MCSRRSFGAPNQQLHPSIRTTTGATLAPTLLAMPSPASPDPRLAPRRAERLVGVVLDGEEVVYDPLLGEAHLLNPTAAVLLARCDGRTPVDDLVDELHRSYGTERAVICADVEAALDDFAARRLVGPEPGPDEIGDRPTGRPGSIPPADPVELPSTWAVVSPVLHALGSRVQVRSDEPLVGRYVDEVLHSLRAPPPGLPRPPAEADRAAVHTFDVVVGGPGPIRLLLDGSVVGSATTLAGAVSYLQWTINQLAVDGGDRLVLLHAAAVRRGNRLAVLPGASNSGKSTLAAGLVEGGFGYVTDEMVAIDAATGAVVPYPKPISLDRGSWPLFPRVEPEIAGTDVAFFTDEWHVVPTALHPDALHPDALDAEADPPRVALVAFPSFRAGAPTAFEPISRAEGLLLMLQSSFNLASVSASGLPALVEVTERASLVRLTVGSLADAVDLIRTAL
jgi:PqqD family protein of HPr-rel-A system